jgi:hypothetical protein
MNRGKMPKNILEPLAILGSQRTKTKTKGTAEAVPFFDLDFRCDSVPLW